jgi:hypothetical protein
MTKKKHNPNSPCEICGAQGVRITLSAEVIDGILIEGIPDYHCDVCGASYYTLDTQKAIDAIRANPKHYAQRKNVLAAALA